MSQTRSNEPLGRLELGNIGQSEEDKPQHRGQTAWERQRRDDFDASKTIPRAWRGAMTDRERQRRLAVENRLAELGGPDLEPVECGPDLAPTWGPIGSLAKQQMTPGEYEHLLNLHENMLALERQRTAVDQPQRPAPVRVPPPAANPPIRIALSMPKERLPAPAAVDRGPLVAAVAPVVSVGDLDV